MLRSLTRDLTAVELVSSCVVRAKALRPLNALITERFNEAEKQAVVSECRSLRGDRARRLEGMPIVVKDNFCTKGIKTSCASNMLNNFVSPYTATVVQRCLLEGAIIVGKSNMDEFALGSGSQDGSSAPVLNPWPLDNLSEMTSTNDSKEIDWRIAGGSSGGSAVAVATSMCAASIGSDTGGSIRNPASYCGVVGLKPTYGRLSRHGLVPLMNGVDCPGVFAADVRTVAAVYEVMSGGDVKDSTCADKPTENITLTDDSSLKGLTVGVPKEFFTENLTEPVAVEWDRCIELMSKLGAKIVEVSLPHNNYATLVYSVLASSDVASNMSRYDGIQYGYRSEDESSTEMLYATSRAKAFSTVVRERILAGNFYLLQSNYEEYYERAQKVQRLIFNDYKQIFSTVDILITPTMHSTAPRTLDYNLEDNQTRIHEFDTFTQAVNLAGVPAINVPVNHYRGQPIGIQLIGDSFHEHLLLHVAKCLESVCHFTLPDLSFVDQAATRTYNKS